MEKQTMKVMYLGEQYEVYSIPVRKISNTVWYFYRVDGGGAIRVNDAIPIPEKPENALEWARILRDSVTNNMSLDKFDEMCDAYESAISRLTAGAWTEEDTKNLVNEFVRYAWFTTPRGRESCELIIRDFFARRKEKEGKV